MAFRANEAAEVAFQRIRTRFIPSSFTASQREKAELGLLDLVERHGPAVDAYPMWHPLVSRITGKRHAYPATIPGPESGYHGLDHTALFAHAFVTCPYDGGKLIQTSFKELPSQLRAKVHLEIEELHFPLYSTKTTPLLVSCKWEGDLEEGHLIPKNLAVAHMLEHVLPWRHWSEVAETWETMRPYLLGQPHGSRASSFVSQDTGLAIKRMHEALNESGMFGEGI